MRLLFVTNAPHVMSSYGQQALHLVRGLRAKGHEIAILAAPGFHGGSTIIGGIPVFGGSVTDIYSQDTVAARAAEWGAQVVVSFMDMWVLKPDLYPNVKHVPYYPVDCEQLKPQEKKVLGHSNIFDRIAYSLHGQKVSAEAGFPSNYLPLGVDTDVFRPLHQDDCRTKMGFPVDALVFGCVAVNDSEWPSKKGWYELLAAWSWFKKQHPDRDTYLYCHTRSIGAMNLKEIASEFGIADSVVFPSPAISGMDGTPVETMAMLYNCMDWLVMPSRGEGAGLPLLEAQACGVPVIAGDWTGMSEHVYGGLSMDKQCGTEEAAHGWMCQGTYRYAVHPQALAEILTLAANMPEEQKALQGDNGKKCVIEKHSWDVVLDQWNKVIEEWEYRINKKPDGRRTERQDLRGSFPESVTRANESEASVVIVCPSWGEQCGIAEYSGHMLWEMVKHNIKAVIARSMAEADVIIRNTLPGKPIETIIVQHEYSFWDNRSYLGQGESTETLCQTLHRLAFDFPELKRALVMHSVTPNPEFLLLHQALAGTNALYTTSEAGRDALLGLIGSSYQVGVLPLDTFTVPGWESPTHVLKEQFTIGNFGMFGPQRKIREQIALCKATGSRFIGSFATADSRVQGEIEKLLAQEGVEGTVFTDWADDRTILSRLAQCDMLYMPRRSGCYYSSASVRLAMLANRPIVVNDDNGYSDIENGTGVIKATSFDHAVEIVNYLKGPYGYIKALIDLEGYHASHLIVDGLRTAGLL